MTPVHTILLAWKAKGVTSVCTSGEELAIDEAISAYSEPYDLGAVHWNRRAVDCGDHIKDLDPWGKPWTTILESASPATP